MGSKNESRITYRIKLDQLVNGELTGPVMFDHGRYVLISISFSTIK